MVEQQQPQSRYSGVFVRRISRDYAAKLNSIMALSRVHEWDKGAVNGTGVGLRHGNAAHSSG
jgi:hypothetical protein